MIPADAWYSIDKLRSLLQSDGPTMIRVPTHRSQRHGIPIVKGAMVTDLETAGEPASRASGGAYRLHRRIFDLLETHEHKLVEAVRADVRAGGGWTVVDAAEHSYVDIVSVQDILDLHQLLLERLEGGNEGTVEPGAVLQGAVRIGKGSTIRTGTVVRGPVRIGENCDVGPLAVLQPGTAIRNHVRVQPFCVLAECVIGSNVEVGSHVRVSRAYVDRGARLDSGVHLRGGPGAIVGADAHLEADACVPEGGVIGHGAHVAAGRTVQTVPDKGWAV
jgi:NDP-sugar pyrophosphorylase family protein